MSVKIKTIIVSLVLCVVLAGVGIGVYCAWPAITGVITDSSYYTSEDLQDSYNKGYDDALKNKTELEGQVEYYKSLTDEYYLSILNYQKQNKDLESNNASLQQNISSLESLKSDLQSQISDYQSQIKNLNTTISENNNTISCLQEQIADKEKQIAELKASGNSKDGQIANLNSEISNLRGQISTLQTLNSQLEVSNQSNLRIISNLNAQIASLNSQIVTLQNQYQSNQEIVNSLNEKIKQLEKSIDYYEQFIESLENGEKIVATFEFNGAVINIQILQKGGKVLFPTPESTDHITFNYWETESGEKVQDTSNYTISENTKFIANATYKYDVKFSVDGVVKETQIVEKDNKPSAPAETPSKAGYDFDGWTLNGVDVVDVTQQSITQNTTFFAKFTQKFTVTFMYESETKSTQQVRSGGHAQNVEIESTKYKKFNGWKVNGEIVTVEDYEIVGDTVFVADVTYFFDVKFVVDGQSYGETQTIEQGKFASKPADPSKSGYDFAGWTVDGSDVVDVSSYAINIETTFTAKFVSLEFKAVDFYIYDPNTEITSPLNIDYITPSKFWSIGDEIYYSYQSNQFEYNKNTRTFTKKTWTGLPSPDGTHIWLIGDKVYYSYYTEQYELDISSSKWNKKTWKGLTSFNGLNVWSLNGKYYVISDGKDYELNISTSTWIEKKWNGYSEIYGSHVWFLDDNVYYSYNSDQYKLDIETDTWVEMTWNGLSSFNTNCIWFYGNDIYYSYSERQYKLDKETNTWVNVTWEGYVPSDGSRIWSDGNNVYYTNKYPYWYVLTRSEI